MMKKTNIFMVNQAGAVRAAHQGINRIESKIEALLIRFTSSNSFFSFPRDDILNQYLLDPHLAL